MKSHLQWLSVANSSCKQINRPMTDKELYVYWFNVFMYDPTDSLEKLYESFLDTSLPQGENPEIIKAAIQDVLKERNE